MCVTQSYVVIPVARPLYPYYPADLKYALKVSQPDARMPNVPSAFNPIPVQQAKRNEIKKSGGHTIPIYLVADERNDI